MPVVGNPIIYLFCVTEYRSDLEAPNITNITLNLIKSVPKILTINNLPQFQKQHQESLESMYRWEHDISFTSTAWSIKFEVKIVLPSPYSRIRRWLCTHTSFLFSYLQWYLPQGVQAMKRRNLPTWERTMQMLSQKSLTSCSEQTCIVGLSYQTIPCEHPWIHEMNKESYSKKQSVPSLTKYISAKRRFVEQELCSEKKPVKQSNGIRSQKRLPVITSQIQ